jgi:8-oxo-dGTP diphosphatase
MTPARLSRPEWPRPGASIAVFRGRSVLLVERAKGIRRGYWSLPGGHIEPGETARAAALRELAEETGVEAEIAGLVDVHDVLLYGDGGELAAHYVLAVYYGRWRQGEPKPSSDVAQALFVPLDALGGYTLTEGGRAVVTRAWSLLGNE